MSKPVCLVVLYPGGKYATENPDLLGAAENGLGLKEFIESHGYEFVSTSDKEGDDSEFDKYLPRAEIIITTPFFPAYVTRERINKAPNLKICITAGVGSDHVLLDACNERGISVLEVTGSNVQSVAEHIVMTMLVLIRNYNEGHYQAISGGWDVAAVASNERDLEGKVIGCVAAGRIARLVFQRLASFNVKKIYYYDYQELPAEEAEKINSVAKILYGTENLLERIESLEELAAISDVITINCPLYEGTRNLFDEKLISKMKKGAVLVNTARGAIANKESVVKGVDLGKFTQNGIQYGGDVWAVQPAPKDDPWRSMKGSGSPEAFVGNAMTIHTSGTSLESQKRYSDGAKLILTEYFNKTYGYRPVDIICIDGDYYTKAYGQRAKKA